jgi:hypothetical protein
MEVFTIPDSGVVISAKADLASPDKSVAELVRLINDK